jgi:hypothetical protein
MYVAFAKPHERWVERKTDALSFRELAWTAGDP